MNEARARARARTIRVVHVRVHVRPSHARSPSASNAKHLREARSYTLTRAYSYTCTLARSLARTSAQVGRKYFTPFDVAHLTSDIGVKYFACDPMGDNIIELVFGPTLMRAPLRKLARKSMPKLDTSTRRRRRRRRPEVVSSHLLVADSKLELRLTPISLRLCARARTQPKEWSDLISLPVRACPKDNRLNSGACDCAARYHYSPAANERQCKRMGTIV